VEMAGGGNPACRWLAGCIGSFWAIRTVLQVGYYSSSHWRGNLGRTIAHAALLLIYGPHSLWLAAGSAQLTRRDLEDYNLEADAVIEIGRQTPFAQQALAYFDSLWANRAPRGIEYTADFAVFADPAQSDYWLYRLMEASGLSGF